MKRFLVGILALGLMTGCVQADNESIEETEVKVEEITDAEASNSGNEPTEDEMTYMRTALNALEVYSKTLDNIDRNFILAEEDRNLLTSKHWKETVKEEFETLDMTHSILIDMQGSIPEGFDEVQTLLEDGFRMTADAGDDLFEVLDSNLISDTEIGIAVKNMKEGINVIGDANKALSEKINEFE